MKSVYPEAGECISSNKDKEMTCAYGNLCKIPIVQSNFGYFPPSVKEIIQKRWRTQNQGGNMRNFGNSTGNISNFPKSKVKSKVNE